MAYPLLLTLNDRQVTSSNLNEEDSILKYYAEILHKMALRVPTQGTLRTEQATTISFHRENKIEETTMALPEEIPEEIPMFLNYRFSKSDETKPEVPLMKGLPWHKEKLELKTSIRHPREQKRKDQEKINIATEETPDNTENTDKDLDHSDMENINLEDDDCSVLETDKSDSEDVLEEPAVDKTGVSTLEQSVKLAMDSTQKPCKKLRKLIVKPLVKEAPKSVPKAPTYVHQKSSLDSAFKLLEEANQQVKKKTTKRVTSGQTTLAARLLMESPETQVRDLGTVISQPSEEDEDQSNEGRVVEDQILKKISDINAEIKRVLKNAEHQLAFKDDVESAKNYLIQSLLLVERKNTSSNEHKPQVNKTKG